MENGISPSTASTQEPGIYSPDESEEENEETWGRLLPVGENFKILNLTKDKYTFGRGDDVDYSFTVSLRNNSKKLFTYSKLHFILTRESTSTGKFAFLQDMSSNGTFINGELVGKSKRQVLNHNDEISLVFDKAFIYFDETSTESSKLPAEILEKYTVSKVLGSGTFGEVRLAFKKGTCEPYAIKLVKNNFTDLPRQELVVKSIFNEVKVMKTLDHPCIVKIYDVIEAEKYFCLVLELVKGGELFDKIITTKKLTEATAKVVFYQICHAIKYLHDRDITHRDIKPENILLTESECDCLVKVTDFGLAKCVGDTFLKTLCGTPTYLAPEVLSSSAKNGTYTKAVDCWSLGVLLYVCLCGFPPFYENEKVPLYRQILKGQYKFPADPWKEISEQGKDLVKRLLTVNPEKRITITEAVQHPWLQDEAAKKRANELMFPKQSVKRPLNEDMNGTTPKIAKVSAR